MPGSTASLRACVFRTREWGFLAVCFLTALFFSATPSQAQRTRLVPSFDLFSSDQDVQMGHESSQEVENELPMCKDPQVDAYLNGLGHKLAALAPGAKYPYQFKCVNDGEVNAFALPGGYLYVNRGTIELVANEAQLAGVMGHEISHVALRHSTAQLTKDAGLELIFVLASGLFGNNSAGGMLAQLGLRGGMGLLALRFSRADESQADILGTQILYDSGYDPRAMAQFFEKLEADSKNHPIQFLSDHPNPDNRAERVMEEVKLLGGTAGNYKTDSADFAKIKVEVHKLPAAPKRIPTQ
jgi:predicted Zn-dependent protease